MTPPNTFSLTLTKKDFKTFQGDRVKLDIRMSTYDMDVILSALKLQELVKNEMVKSHLVNTANVLRLLVEESEK